MALDRFPLSWPTGYPVTEQREISNFKCTFIQARDGMINEFKLLLTPTNFSNLLISCNMPHNKNGLITGSSPLMYPNPGVAVYFTFAGDEKVIACDHWRYLHDNFRAIQYTVQSLRSLERQRCTQILSRAMGDMKALPERGEERGDSWWEMMGVEPDANWSTVELRYKELVKHYHPDKATGSADMFILIQKAYAEAKKKFNK